MIELERGHLAEVSRILGRYLPDECEVRAFGSRVTGGARRYSDLDLVICCAEPPSEATLEALRDALSESDLPISVDVSLWHELPRSLRDTIEASHVVVLPRRVPLPAG